MEAPGRLGAKVTEYQAYSELSQIRKAECIGVKNVYASKSYFYVEIWKQENE